MSAHLRIQSYTVREVAIFVLNVLAFILAGLHLRPILAHLGGADWRAILIVCIVVRIEITCMIHPPAAIACRTNQLSPVKSKSSTSCSGYR